MRTSIPDRANSRGGSLVAWMACHACAAMSRSWLPIEITGRPPVTFDSRLPVSVRLAALSNSWTDRSLRSKRFAMPATSASRSSGGHCVTTSSTGSRAWPSSAGLVSAGILSSRNSGSRFAASRTARSASGPLALTSSLTSTLSTPSGLGSAPRRTSRPAWCSTRAVSRAPASPAPLCSASLQMMMRLVRLCRPRLHNSRTPTSPMPTLPSLPEPGGSPPPRLPVVRPVWPFEAGQTRTVNRRSPQSGRGLRGPHGECDIGVAFTTAITSGRGAGGIIVEAFALAGLPLVESAQLAAQGLAEQHLLGAAGLARALEDRQQQPASGPTHETHPRHPAR